MTAQQATPAHDTAEPGPAEVPRAPRCSATRCGERAVAALHWNNPKLHDPQRRKTWLACERHRRSLGEFLDRRGFLRETATVDAV